MVDTEEMILAVGIEGPGQPDVRNLGGGLNSSTKGPAASQGSGRVDLLLLVLLSHFSCVRLCATPETAAHQAPPSLYRQTVVPLSPHTPGSLVCWL